MKSENCRFFLPLIMAIFLLGCTAISREELARGNYGQFPNGYEDAIKGYMKMSLFDPYSAQYEFGKPYKAAAYRGLLNGGGWAFGYAVDVAINAKNRMGAYVGYKPHTFFFSDGKVYDIIFKDDLYPYHE